MLPISLWDEDIVEGDGFGPTVDVSRESGKLLVVTLAITRLLQQESLEISVWGSPDGTDWGTRPLTSFPQKFYCGLYSILLNLAAQRQIAYLRLQWKIKILAKAGNIAPLAGFYVQAEESGSRMQSAVA